MTRRGASAACAPSHCLSCRSSGCWCCPGFSNTLLCAGRPTLAAAAAMARLFVLLPVWTALIIAAACQTCPARGSEPELYSYEVVAEYPHDSRAFTQGLQFDTVCESATECREVLWESTGMYGDSSMRLVHLDSGVVEKSVPLSAQWFGEGVARLGDKLYQITWLTNKGFVYSVPGLEQLGSFSTPLKDGWGITAAGKLLVLSDGSDKLTWVDPAKGFARVRSVTVKDGDRPVPYLNELEFIGGEVWANVWQTDCIARICPDSGRVKAWLLLHELRDKLMRRNLGAMPMDVLNGIAWDHQRQRLFITGKYWPRLFEVVPLPVTDANELAAAQRRRQSCIVNRGG